MADRDIREQADPVLKKKRKARGKSCFPCIYGKSNEKDAYVKTASVKEELPREEAVLEDYEESQVDVEDVIVVQQSSNAGRGDDHQMPSRSKSAINFKLRPKKKKNEEGENTVEPEMSMSDERARKGKNKVPQENWFKRLSNKVLPPLRVEREFEEELLLILRASLNRKP